MRKESGVALNKEEERDEKVECIIVNIFHKFIGKREGSIDQECGFPCWF